MTALPDSIIQNGLFCCWKYEERNGRKTKMPYQPETGLGAKSNDPSSFVPYKTAVQASGYDGIAATLSPTCRTDESPNSAA